VPAVSDPDGPDFGLAWIAFCLFSCNDREHSKQVDTVGRRPVKSRLTIALATLLLAATYAMPSYAASAKAKPKSCFEVCGKRGGISNRQVQRCVNNCENTRSGKR